MYGGGDGGTTGVAMMEVLWFSDDVVVGLVTECNSGLHQKDDGCGVKADGKDDV